MENHDLTTNTSLITVVKSIQEDIRSNLLSLPFIQVLKDRYKAYSRRQKLLYLLKYDDLMLDDMGYTRQYLHVMAKLPLSSDTHQLLKHLEEERKSSQCRR